VKIDKKEKKEKIEKIRFLFQNDKNKSKEGAR
jgi:hypothetical protein